MRKTVPVESEIAMLTSSETNSRKHRKKKDEEIPTVAEKTTLSDVEKKIEDQRLKENVLNGYTAAGNKVVLSLSTWLIANNMLKVKP